MTGILFDLDGTLLDTLEDLTDATNYALAAHGYPARTTAEIRRFVGNGALNQIRLSLPEGSSEEAVAEVLNTYKPYYTAHCQCKTAPYSGVLEALSALKENYPIAIVSNKPDAAVKALCADFFPGIYSLGETADCPRKPAPDMVYKAMAAIGADRCVYVGDSEVDVLTAKPMIVSTNLTVDEMLKRYSPQIASRLRGSFTRVAFLGEDIRVLKNRGY